MPIRVTNLRLDLDEPLDALPDRFASCSASNRRASIGESSVRAWTRATSATSISFATPKYTFRHEDGLSISRGHDMARPRSSLHSEPPFAMPAPGTQPLPHRPVVVGSGPAGWWPPTSWPSRAMRRWYWSAAAGHRAHPRRSRVRRRRAVRPESNYLFGEGGAGTFSDGKLTCRARGPDVHRVLELFAECKGKPSILYEHRPHLGSNRLPAVVKAIRRRIEAHGRRSPLLLPRRRPATSPTAGSRPGHLVGLLSRVGRAAGHRPQCPRYLRHAVRAAACRWCKSRSSWACASSIRKRRVNRVQYGADAAGRTARQRPTTPWWPAGRHDLFTFCMCAGGHIIPSVSEDGYFCTNGMSLSKRDSPLPTAAWS